MKEYILKSNKGTIMIDAKNIVDLRKKICMMEAPKKRNIGYDVFEFKYFDAMGRGVKEVGGIDFWKGNVYWASNDSSYQVDVDPRTGKIKRS